VIVTSESAWQDKSGISEEEGWGDDNKHSCVESDLSRVPYPPAGAQLSERLRGHQMVH
jgi:hypothetical protein